MKQIKIKEIETTPLILSILLWYIKTFGEWLITAGYAGLIIAGLTLLTIALHAPYWYMIGIIAAIAAIHTGWIVYKAFKTGKVKWKRKKKGENDEHL